MKTDQQRMHHVTLDMMHFLSSGFNVTTLFVAAFTRGSVSTRKSLAGG
jgi:hypothetical protein